jgi:predicted HNH restriction endonuclease
LPGAAGWHWADFAEAVKSIADDRPAVSTPFIAQGAYRPAHKNRHERPQSPSAVARSVGDIVKPNASAVLR